MDKQDLFFRINEINQRSFLLKEKCPTVVDHLFMYYMQHNKYLISLLTPSLYTCSLREGFIQIQKKPPKVKVIDIGVRNTFFQTLQEGKLVVQTKSSSSISTESDWWMLKINMLHSYDRSSVALQSAMLEASEMLIISHRSPTTIQLSLAK